MPLLGCPKFVVTFCMRCVAFGCIAFEWSLYLDVEPPCVPIGAFECCAWFTFDDAVWLVDCCCDCDCDDSRWSSAVFGSYLRGRPRDKWRRFTNSLSSTIQNEPKSSSYLTKHLCSDKFVRIAFYSEFNQWMIFVCVCFLCVKFEIQLTTFLTDKFRRISQ